MHGTVRGTSIYCFLTNFNEFYLNRLSVGFYILTYLAVLFYAARIEAEEENVNEPLIMRPQLFS